MAEGDRLASERRLNREGVLTVPDVHPGTQDVRLIPRTEEKAITAEAYLPAWRATRVEPLQTLRAD
jgi:hypothetical protein